MPTVSGEVGDEQLAHILRQARRIAVVGLSPRLDRPSHEVARYLQQQGYTIYPVNPTQLGSTILGRQVFARLSDLPEPPDIVDVFRRPQYVPDVVADAMRAREKWQPSAEENRRGALWVIWTQLGVVHDEAARLAHAEGFPVVEDRCLKVEHMRLRIRPVDQPGTGEA